MSAVQLSMLCALAGVSKRTLYERFPGGKQECFVATYDIIVRSAQTSILAAGRRGPDTPGVAERTAEQAVQMRDVFALSSGRR